MESQSACELEWPRVWGLGTLIAQCWTYPRTLVHTSTLRPRDIKTEDRLRIPNMELPRDEARPNPASIYGTGTWVATFLPSFRRHLLSPSCFLRARVLVALCLPGRLVIGAIHIISSRRPQQDSQISDGGQSLISIAELVQGFILHDSEGSHLGSIHSLVAVPSAP